MLEDYRQTKRQMWVDIGILSISSYTDRMSDITDLVVDSERCLRRSQKYFELSKKYNDFETLISPSKRKFVIKCIERSKEWLEESKKANDKVGPELEIAINNFSVPMYKEIDAEIKRYPDLSMIYLGDD